MKSPRPQKTDDYNQRYGEKDLIKQHEMGIAEGKRLERARNIKIIKEHIFNTYPINCDAICREIEKDD